MEKSDYAGIGFFILFIILNMGYEYLHTMAETTLEQFLGSVIIIIAHIGYVLCIKNLKWK